MNRSALAGAVLLVVLATAEAQDKKALKTTVEKLPPNPKLERLPQVYSFEEGKEICLVPRADLTLREQPPSGLFYSYGAEKGKVPQGVPLVVTGAKDVRTLLGEYEWIQVALIDPKTQKLTGGWVHAGKAGEYTYLGTLPCSSELTDRVHQSVRSGELKAWRVK